MNRHSTFRELVTELYLDRGIAKTDAIAQIRQQSGASRNTLLAAYQGTAIAIESAAKLTQWCTLHHPGHALGFVELVSAPTAPNSKRRSIAQGEPGVRSRLPFVASPLSTWRSAWRASRRCCAGSGGHEFRR